MTLVSTTSGAFPATMQITSLKFKKHRRFTQLHKGHHTYLRADDKTVAGASSEKVDLCALGRANAEKSFPSWKTYGVWCVRATTDPDAY